MDLATPNSTSLRVATVVIGTSNFVSSDPVYAALKESEYLKTQQTDLLNRLELTGKNSLAQILRQIKFGGDVRFLTEYSWDRYAIFEGSFWGNDQAKGDK
ncbi:hypothetical protein [Acetobacteroides hydrogenigenes]|uniref:Uncharacterized protein n=1 Tax=Acetobacteroides hydrogenigenes TaxID=979970 RepID=A0A4R2EQT8_9BACT|nr:hypothetical protein [Acetobacteroides hydrogenigenes]TCN68994.1 hypothetical protein CLV25_105196 [Acetobacteroides hydrogenigenes]